MLGTALCLMSENAPAASDPTPAGLETMRALALRLLSVEEYERSVAVYREIAAQTPADAESHYDLAAALSFLQRYEEAAAPIEAAIRLAPDNLGIQEMAALIFLNLRWYKKAFDATLKAAELGEPTAMFSLVNMYEKGLGVAEDADRAVYWAVQAAEQGHLGAMALMEGAYRTGRFGRRVDVDRAEAWAERLRQAQLRFD